MHFSVKTHAQQRVSAISLQRTTVVAQRYPRDARDHPVCNTAHEIAPNRRVLPVFAPAGHHVITFIEFGEQKRNVLRIVLKVGIDRDNYIAARVINAGHDRRGLACIAAELDDFHFGAGRRDPRELCHRVVAAAIVYRDDFKTAANSIKNFEQTLE